MIVILFKVDRIQHKVDRIQLTIFLTILDLFGNHGTISQSGVNMLVDFRFVTTMLQDVLSKVLLFAQGDVLDHILIQLKQYDNLLTRRRHFANRPMQYTAKINDCKNGNFQMKNCDIFLIFAHKIDCGYTLEPPQ